MKKKIFALLVLLLSTTAAFAQYTNTPNIGLKVPIRGSNNWDIPLYYDWTMIDNMLGGQTALPNGLKVIGPVSMPGFTFTSAQIVAGLGYQPLNPANNLSDVNNAATALANLGGIGANSYQGTWSSSTSYTAAAFVNYNGVAYISLQTGNVNNEPDTSPSYWGALGGALPVGSSSQAGILKCGSGTTCTSGVISASGGASPGGTAGAMQYYLTSSTLGGLNGTGLTKLNGASAPTIAVANTDYTTPNNLGVVYNLPVQSFKNASNPQLATWLQAFHNCQNQVVHVTLLADSQGMVDQGNSSEGPTVATNRYADQLRTYLSNVCGSHGTGVTPIWAFLYPGSPNPVNDNWTATGTLAQSAILGPSQNSTLGPYAGTTLGAVTQMSTGAVLTFTSPWAYDHVNLYYVQTTSAVSIGIKVDGSSVGTITNTAGSPTAALFTSSSFTSATHTTTITCTTGPCYVYALEGTNGTTGASVDNLSLASGVAENYSGASGSTPFAFADLIPGGIQLVIEAYGTNEPSLGYSTSSYTAAIAAIVNHEVSLNNSSVLVTSPPVNNEATYGPQMVTYAAAALAEVQTLNVAYINYQSNWGTTFVAGLFGSDGVHPNDKGTLSEYSMIKSSAIDTDPNSSSSLTNIAYTNVANTFTQSQTITGASLLVKGTSANIDVQGSSSSTLSAIELDASLNTSQNGQQWFLWAQSTAGQNGLVIHDNSLSGGIGIAAWWGISGTSYENLSSIGGYCFNSATDAAYFQSTVDTCMWRDSAGNFDFGNATLKTKTGLLNAAGVVAISSTLNNMFNGSSSYTGNTNISISNTSSGGKLWYMLTSGSANSPALPAVGWWGIYDGTDSVYAIGASNTLVESFLPFQGTTANFTTSITTPALTVSGLGATLPVCTNGSSALTTSSCNVLTTGATQTITGAYTFSGTGTTFSSGNPIDANGGAEFIGGSLGVNAVGFYVSGNTLFSIGNAATFVMAPATTTATPSNNYASTETHKQASYYTGSASTIGGFDDFVTPGTGNNPVLTIGFTFNPNDGTGTGGTAIGQATFGYPIGLEKFTVSTLPSGYSAGQMVEVTDATTFTPGTCTGGGSDYMIAIYSGSAWSCH